MLVKVLDWSSLIVMTKCVYVATEGFGGIRFHLHGSAFFVYLASDIISIISLSLCDRQ